MKTPLVASMLFVLLQWQSGSAEDLEIQPGTKVEFSTREQAAKLLGERDAFVAALSPFDRAARLKTDRETTEKAYLEFVAAQAEDWSAAEKELVTGLLTKLKPKVAALKLALPPVVRLLKTTGKEEGAAAYCRGACITLPTNMLASGPSLANTLAHEMFHVYSNQNPKLRPALYAVVGFAPCGAVKFPESLASRKLTNPDAYGLDFGDKKVPVMPVLYSRSEKYDLKAGGEFFDYMEFRLLVLEKDGEGYKAALDAKGLPRLLSVDEAPDYLEQVGKNTEYIIHPEEVLADNFVLLLDGKKKVASPQIVEGLRKAIAAAAR
ncbi:MAG: hypothetical protein K8T20_15570 [Planctomycetes bacterium]|nr:hypothetical protein [Planctomycetota bacterium]